MTRTTFEERLLAELRGEVERRQAGLREAERRQEVERWQEGGPERVGLRRLLSGRLLPGRRFTGSRLAVARLKGSRLKAARLTGSRFANRLMTGRRLVLAGVVCALAGLAVLLVPGTPAGSPAYAVERHGDGTVTLTVKDQEIDIGAQRELAGRLRPNGIDVEVQVLPRGYVCQGDPVFWALTHQGEKVPLYTLQLNKPTTLRPGNVLVFVNLKGGELPHKVDVYPTRADVDPCVPVKPTPDQSGDRSWHPSKDRSWNLPGVREAPAS